MHALCAICVTVTRHCTLATDLTEHEDPADDDANDYTFRDAVCGIVMVSILIFASIVIEYWTHKMRLSAGSLVRYHASCDQYCRPSSS